MSVCVSLFVSTLVSSHVCVFICVLVCVQMENWLYEEEAETANKSLFISKLDELKKFGEPPAERFREEEQRPDAYRELEKVLTEPSDLAATSLIPNA